MSDISTVVIPFKVDLNEVGAGVSLSLTEREERLGGRICTFEQFKEEVGAEQRNFYIPIRTVLIQVGTSIVEYRIYVSETLARRERNKS